MKGNAVLPISVAATILFVILIFFIILFVIIHQKKRNKLRIEKHKAIFEEQERTMTQVSKEVHDNLGGFLNLALMNIEVVKGHPLNAQQKEAIQNAGSIVSQLIVEVHNISHSMNSNYIRNRGLFDVLNAQLKYIASTKNITCDIDVIGEEEVLDEGEQLLVYRIAQEAIQNTLKHADATLLNIILKYEPRLFSMIISDNGTGFDKDEVLSADGIGLMNMQERAQMLGAQFEIDSSPGNGCLITLTLQKAENRKVA